MLHHPVPVLHTRLRVPALPAEEANPGKAAADGALCPPHPLRSVPGDLQLQQLDFPPQELVLLLAPGHLQVNHRVSIVHNFTDFRHGRVSQHLHDGGDLRVEVHGGRHLQTFGPLTEGGACALLLLLSDMHNPGPPPAPRLTGRTLFGSFNVDGAFPEGTPAISTQRPLRSGAVLPVSAHHSQS